MARNNQSAALSEVVDFLSARKNDYLKLLRMTLEELGRFKDRPQFRDVVYRIYSRADKQLGGEALKAPEKIAKKLIEWREKKPSTKVQEIHDIIGITLVVYFQSQRDAVAKGLRERKALGKVRVYEYKLRESDGYYAVHMKFACEEPGLDGLKGELQVKSLLHDGWAAKTHDMTYKPAVALTDDVRMHTRILGDTLELVEQQSDIIRSLIERERERENRRRRAAQERLMATMTIGPAPDFDRRAATLARAVRKDVDHLRTSNESDRRFKRHFRNWKNFLKTQGPKRSACRLITFLASVRDAQDLTNVAFDTIDEWIAQSADGAPKQNALIFRAVAQYMLGSFEASVADARRALVYSEKRKLDIGTAMSNLAYLLCEDYLQRKHRLTGGQQKNMLREISKISKELRTGGFDKDPIYADTLGAIAIVTGKSQEEVRAGLEQCRQALQQAKPKDPFYESRKAYYLLHEQRALLRLLDLGAVPQTSAA